MSNNRIGILFPTAFDSSIEIDASLSLAHSIDDISTKKKRKKIKRRKICNESRHRRSA